jgi:hypothetical protein
VEEMLPPSAAVEFGEIEKENWTIPSWLSEEEVKASELSMEYQGVK